MGRTTGESLWYQWVHHSNLSTNLSWKILGIGVNVYFKGTGVKSCVAQSAISVASDPLVNTVNPLIKARGVYLKFSEKVHF